MKKLLVNIFIVIAFITCLILIMPPFSRDHLATVPVKGKPYNIVICSSVGVSTRTYLYKRYFWIFNIPMSDTSYTSKVINYEVKDDTLILLLPRGTKDQYIMKVKIK